jgi:hypothetical protein
MARVLIVGGGCRGLALARELRARGDAVRISSRAGRNRAAIESAGAECWPGDPDVVGTLRYALDGVSVLVWALGNADGPADSVSALHGSRLENMLARTIDTTVRGVVYEAAGSAGAGVLAGGAAIVREVAERFAIPYSLLESDPNDVTGWATAAMKGIDEVLGARRGVT